MSPIVVKNLRKVVIEGLQKIESVEQGEDIEQGEDFAVTIGDENGLYNLSLDLNDDELMWPSLWRSIQACGFRVPHRLAHGEAEYELGVPLTVVREYDEVQVVADDQASTPTTIKMSETLISHTNTHHVPPLEFNLHNDPVVRDNHSFSVSFERTTRIPDDNKLHHLPSSLGSYQVFSVDKYSRHLPKNITETGGVFFPMWQREAMWINFRHSHRKYAVRVFVGRVNAITGQEMQSEKDAKYEDKLQDHLVIPGQRWLDGICVAPGVVRQFVAMPLGSGYTVEGQKTSEEKFGGMQIEVTPQMEHGIRGWARAGHQRVTYPANRPSSAGGLSEHCTPRDLGCKVGDTLRSYPTGKEFKQSFRIQDLFAPEAEGKGQNNAPQGNDSPSVPTVTLKAIGGVVSLPYLSRDRVEYHSAARVRDMLPRPGAAAPRCAAPAPAHNAAQAPQAPSSAPRPYSLAPYQSSYSPPISQMMAPLSAYPESTSATTEPFYSKPARPAMKARVNSSIDLELSPASHPFSSGSVKGFEKAEGKPLGLGLLDKVSKSSPTDENKTDLMELTEEQAKNVKTLGLAAGGKLIQDIYKDPFPATTWNHAGARILYVHMIDPESFEKVTHIVPQPPPVAVEDYVKSGGQFWVVEEKVDKRLDGGDFGNVKSVSQMDQHVGITTEPEFDPKKPKMCTTCERRLCDCIIRPCNHQFCNVCIKRLEEASDTEQSVQQKRHWKCPTCSSPVSHVAGFSAPMNLPGEERLVRTKVPVHVLKIEDGRTRFTSMQTSRV